MTHRLSQQKVKEKVKKEKKEKKVKKKKSKKEAEVSPAKDESPDNLLMDSEATQVDVSFFLVNLIDILK